MFPGMGHPPPLSGQPVPVPHHPKSLSPCTKQVVPQPQSQRGQTLPAGTGDNPILNTTPAPRSVHLDPSTNTYKQAISLITLTWLCIVCIKKYFWLKPPNSSIAHSSNFLRDHGEIYSLYHTNLFTTSLLHFTAFIGLLAGILFLSTFCFRKFRKIGKIRSYNTKSGQIFLCFGVKKKNKAEESQNTSSTATATISSNAGELAKFSSCSMSCNTQAMLLFTDKIYWALED